MGDAGQNRGEDCQKDNKSALIFSPSPENKAKGRGKRTRRAKGRTKGAARWTKGPFDKERKRDYN